MIPLQFFLRKASSYIEQEANRILSVISEFMGINTLFVALNDENTNYIVKALNHQQTLIEEGTALPFCESYCYWVARERHYLEIPNTQKDERTQDLTPTIQLGPTTFVGVPITLRDGRVVGTICGMDSIPFQLTLSQQELLNMMASLMAHVVELECASYTDPLTGIANRRVMDHFLESPSNHNEMKAVIFWDVDNLKPINDTWGHHAGDEAISHVVKHIRAALPKNHVFCRIGGDEFVVFLPQCNSDDAQSLAKYISQRLHHSSIFAPNGEEIWIEITTGVATTSNMVHPWQELLKEADRAMYQGKQKGRGHIIHRSL